MRQWRPPSLFQVQPHTNTKRPFLTCKFIESPPSLPMIEKTVHHSELIFGSLVWSTHIIYHLSAEEYQTQEGSATNQPLRRRKNFY